MVPFVGDVPIVNILAHCAVSFANFPGFSIRFSEKLLPEL